MNLPEDFQKLMTEHLGLEQAASLFEGLATEPSVSVRLNPYKKLGDLDLERVPWCPDAYYLTERPAFTFDPLFHAGMYYVQEASSMYVAHMLQAYGPTAPCCALDLCAAPGGKSTLLAGNLPQGSVLISNEPMPKRANILAENMQKWTQMPEGRYPVTCITTNNYPANFGAFTEEFDLLVTDVPCSGEGMFRKDEVAVQEWSLDNVDTCWHRQRDILSDIWHALKPGGLLLYSTCTFNCFEDEDNARWICRELGGELLEERHFLPGRDRGEGFYIAAIRKTGELQPSQLSMKKLKTLKVLFNSETVELPEGPRIELSYAEALQYLRREAVRVEAPRGPVVLCHRGLILGQGKGVGNRINNLYPDPWRIRTTYMSEFTLM